MPSESVEIVEDLKEAQEKLEEATEEFQEAKEDLTEARQDLTKVKKKKNSLLKKKSKSSEEAKLSELDKIHLKYNAVCFSEPVNKFKFYAIDQDSMRRADYKTMIKRGVIMLSTLEDWYKLVEKHGKALHGFKPLYGAVVLQRYSKHWACLSMHAQKERRSK